MAPLSLNDNWYASIHNVDNQKWIAAIGSRQNTTTPIAPTYGYHHQKITGDSPRGSIFKHDDPIIDTADVKHGTNDLRNLGDFNNPVSVSENSFRGNNIYDFPVAYPHFDHNLDDPVTTLDIAYDVTNISEVPISYSDTNLNGMNDFNWTTTLPVNDVNVTAPVPEIGFNDFGDFAIPFPLPEPTSGMMVGSQNLDNMAQGNSLVGFAPSAAATPPTHTANRPFACSHAGCNKSFKRKGDCKRHNKKHGPVDLFCAVSGCTKAFHRKDKLVDHLRNKHHLTV